MSRPTKKEMFFSCKASLHCAKLSPVTYSLGFPDPMPVTPLSRVISINALLTSSTVLNAMVYGLVLPRSADHEVIDFIFILIFFE